MSALVFLYRKIAQSVQASYRLVCTHKPPRAAQRFQRVSFYSNNGVVCGRRRRFSERSRLADYAIGLRGCAPEYCQCFSGSLVALYFCVQSLFVSIIGSLVVTTFNGGTAWSLVVYTSAMALLVLSALRSVQLHGR